MQHRLDPLEKCSFSFSFFFSQNHHTWWSAQTMPFFDRWEKPPITGNRAHFSAFPSSLAKRPCSHNKRNEKKVDSNAIKQRLAKHSRRNSKSKVIIPTNAGQSRLHVAEQIPSNRRWHSLEVIRLPEIPERAQWIPEYSHQQQENSFLHGWWLRA